MTSWLVGVIIIVMKRLCILLLLVPHLSLSQDYDGQIRAKEEKLNEIRAKIEECRKKSEELSNKESGVLTTLESMDEELNLTKKLVAELRGKENRIEKEIEKVADNLAMLQERLQKRRDIFEKRLKNIYKYGKYHSFETILLSDSFSQAYKRIKYLILIARQDRKLLDEIVSIKKTRITEKEKLEKKLSELLDVTEEKNKEKKNLEKDRNKKEEFLSEIRKQKEKQRKLEAELRETEQKIQSLIIALEKAKEEAMEEEIKFSPFEVFKGRLPWPIEGEVLSKYGKIKHPKYNTSTMNNGIDISAKYGQPVYSVGDGKVVYAGKFLGYGQVVLVDHHSGYYTLYANLSEILVQVGENIAEREEIGYAGESALGDANLHFEVREKGKPVDPLQWLAKLE